MIISIWRYSHLILAVSSFVFILIASVTGVILAFEPVSYQLSDYKVEGSDQVLLMDAFEKIQTHYDEVFNLSVDENGLVSVSAIDKEGNMGDFYINPTTGEQLGVVEDQQPLFEFVTSLHRSLFLKGFGRFFIGLSALCLLLIAITGVVLIIKRQQGIKHFFSKIINENFYQYYHVYMGRLALIPILIISLTGTYLFLQRFSVIPESTAVQYDIDYEALSEIPTVPPGQFESFNNMKLGELRVLEFPFSPDVEDYYVLELKDRELLVNQYTGEVIDQTVYPFVNIISELSLILHTGRGNIWWALILGLSSLGLPFFIYSGFVMTFKRRASKIKNSLQKADCKYIILVGSETGTTIPFAMQLHQQLLENGQSSYITEMNRYERFESMEHLIVLTSTYGHGEAPVNASNFIKLFKDYTPEKAFSFSVLGFGSLAYPDFCQFAKEVDLELGMHPLSKRKMELQTVNNRSWESFRQWARQLSQVDNLSLQVPAKNPVDLKPKKVQGFKIISKTKAEDSPDDTFIIELSNPSNKIKSGDLLGIYPPNEHERLYSIALINGNIIISVKRHELGVCSNYLNNLKVGNTLAGCLVKNKNFHLPAKSKKVIMVATGTGIAPYLGMINNGYAGDLHLYWGARNESSYEIYKPFVDQALVNKKLQRFIPAYSRSGGAKLYVQHLLEKDAHLLAQTLKGRGIIMLCGSIAMQREVTNVLEQICVAHNGKKLSYYQNNGQLKMDCY